MAEFSPEKLFARAVADQQAGRLDAAEATYRTLLDRFPDQIDVAHNLSRVLMVTGRAQEAVAVWQRLTALHPDDPRPALERAMVQITLGKQGAAEADLQTAARLARDDAAWRRIASAYVTLRRFDLAVDAFQHALTLGPSEAVNYSGFASLCNELGDYRLAADIARAAIQLSPESGIGWLELGNALMHQCDYHAAAEAFLHLVQLCPDSPDAYCNLGLIHHEAMCLDEAIASFDTAIALDPGHEMARWNRSLALLTQGKLAEAWPDYELRRSTAIQKLRPPPSCPEWQGERLAGKTIILVHEQGLGDSLQFIRYAGLLRDLGARVWVRAPESLLRLFRTAAGVDAVFSDQAHFPEGADCHALLLSLPLRFATTLESIPRNIPYLFADGDEVAAWAQRVSTQPRLPRVGLVWAGGKRLENASATRMDERRSLSLAQLTPILEIPCLHFVSLQKGGAEAEIVTGNFCHRIAAFTPFLEDMAATAALIANLDLVIGVDTSIVHLAGALGKPVWLLNRFDTDWRWLAETDDCPWYPSLRQFRQPAPGDWNTPIRNLSAALRHWSAGAIRTTE